jgi:hypothetical protein
MCFGLDVSLQKNFTLTKGFSKHHKGKNKLTLEVLLIGGMVRVNINYVFCIHFVHYYA